MRHLSIYLILLLLTACSGGSGTQTNASDEGPNLGEGTSPVFQLIDQAESGVVFANNIIENETYNHLKWSHVYSGAGVAAGDFNNDGLADLFFAGNQVGDRLYLNKGDFKFEDVTSKAGIRQDNKWSMGVTVVDINDDGWLDVYLCRNEPNMDKTFRKNRLYVNNGDGTFTDQAEAMGLADSGFSIQATFFDYDQDGDLDCYVVNQPPDGRFIMKFKLDMENDRMQWSDRLYENTGGGQFRDVSQESGLLSFGYGLNVVANDLNQDGLTDLYVTNDYYEPDFFYINQGDGTFKDEALKRLGHISNFSMGSDVNDFNNDGLPDIGVVDMAAPDHFRSKTNMASMRPDRFWKLVEEGNHYQYMSNTLQLNTGTDRFSEVAFQTGMAKTDWSWSLLMADFDNDGYRDFALTNGIQRDMRNNDFQYKILEANKRGQRDFKIMDVIKMVPSQPISNYLYRNPGRDKDGETQLKFEDVTKAWGFDQPGFSNGMAIADLDNDGDLDMVINNVSAPASLYQNVAGNQKNYLRIAIDDDVAASDWLNARVSIDYGDQQQTTEVTPTRGYLSASETVAHFGLGDQTLVDRLRILWPNGKQTTMEAVEANQLIKVNPASATPTTANNSAIQSSSLLVEIDPIKGLAYRHRENEFDDFAREILLPHKQSEHGPHLSTGDVNGDGLDDLFIGGAMGEPARLFVQSAAGTFSATNTTLWLNEQAYEDLGSLFFDADGDQDFDLYVVSGGSERAPGATEYQDRLYLNDGAGNFTKGTSNLPFLPSSGEVVKAVDLEGDGDLDLFVGGRLVPGKYPAVAKSYLLQNDQGTFTDVTEQYAPELSTLGMVTDALFTDYDGDQDADLIAVGEWMKIRVFRNDGNSFTETTKALGLDKSTAWWWSIAEGDFDADGDPDYLIGNLGKNTKYKATAEKPLYVYANDFDHNGTNDVVLASYNGDEVVPVRGRECSSEQMPFIADKFPTYEGFATANLEAILPEEEFDQAVKHEVYSFASILLKNNGDNFEMIALPDLAQVGPIRDVIITDLNADGHLDALCTGNMYAAEVETSRYDANLGMVLLGNGQGAFRTVPARESGWITPYDARDIASLETAQGRLYLVGNNREALQFFRATSLQGK